MPDFELDETAVARFEADGFVLVDDLIDMPTVERLRESFERLFRGEWQTGVMPDEVNWQTGKSREDLTRQICNGWKADLAVASVVLRGDFGRAVARLAGWPGARIMIDNVLWKPAGARPLGFHQDNSYLQWFAPGELLSLWIAMDDTSAVGGTMELVRGSHRWHHAPPAGEFRSIHRSEVRRLSPPRSEDLADSSSGDHADARVFCASMRCEPRRAGWSSRSQPAPLVFSR